MIKQIRGVLAKNCNRSCSTGQVMLLTALLISGIVLSITSLAGLLTVYQLRQVTDVNNSTKAIFAADTGIEWELYKKFKDAKAPAPACPGKAPAQLCNGVTFQTFPDPANPNNMMSVGTSGRSSRALQTYFK
jgi:hypothetical protein